ncbi:MAG: tRNA pseudouridine(13) synthase TruD [Candidatus Omnitrophica bacterium]|nr:tRNA pseudouridine(13) synthase TruD [Candidatus Omnitrophota bacterium]
MKIKTRPQDFIVNEIANIEFKQNGRFKVYLLIKRNFNTIDVLIKLAKKFNLPLSIFGYGGRKDKYAYTYQYITIKDFKVSSIKEKSFEIKYLGDALRPMGPDLILANEFKITIRDLKEKELICASEALDFVKNFGFPNYFDDQRFGSYSPSQGFFAEKLIKKEFNGALKIYLTSIYPEDKKEEKKRKKFFFENWGDWKECLLKAKTDFEKKAFRILSEEKKPFLKILGLIPKEELRMLISSFQSYLWNKLVERLIKIYTSKLLTYRGNYWDYFFYASEETFKYLKDLKLPLASSKTEIPEEVCRNLYEQILREHNLKPPLFNLRRFRKAYFKPTLREVIVLPQIKEFHSLDDQLYPHKKALYLEFSLPAGSYATMLIKRLFAT